MKPNLEETTDAAKTLDFLITSAGMAAAMSRPVATFAGEAQSSADEIQTKPKPERKTIHEHNHN
jgi:hypothetical protein